MNNRKMIPVLITLFFIIYMMFSGASAEEFTGPIDYQSWAANEGYPQGLLIPMGISGINQDHFHSLPDSPGYTSGRIVIGDSRSCQLGIYQDRTGAADFAVFAVWGGHYIPGTGTSIMTEDLWSALEQCFREQVRIHGGSTVFFFATVNDYDPTGIYNTAYISTAVSAAERIASLSAEHEGRIVHPKVIVIGPEGVDAANGMSGIDPRSFNRFISTYNKELFSAVNESPVLNETAHLFTTVSKITGGRTTFISDGLHYSEDTLRKTVNYLVSIAGTAEGTVP